MKVLASITIVYSFIYHGNFTFFPKSGPAKFFESTFSQNSSSWWSSITSYQWSLIRKLLKTGDSKLEHWVIFYLIHKYWKNNCQHLNIQRTHIKHISVSFCIKMVRANNTKPHLLKLDCSFPSPSLSQGRGFPLWSPRHFELLAHFTHVICFVPVAVWICNFFSRKQNI